MDGPAYLIAGLIVAFALWQLTPLLGARRARGREVPQLTALLNERQRSQSRLLVYFCSPRCGMCQTMTTVIERLADVRDDVVKIDITEAPAVARAFGVMATPSLALVEHGAISRLMVGARTEAQVMALLSV